MRPPLGKSKYLLVAFLAAVSCALFAAPASAAPASGEDQYLEVVPDGAGDNVDREKANEDFAESVGGKDGVITEEGVRRAAEENAKKGAGSKNEESDPAPEKTGPAIAAPINAAKSGAIGTGTILAIVAVISAIGGFAIVSRRRRTA